MATNTIKRDSTYPYLSFRFLNKDGLPVDCTQFGVYLIVKDSLNKIIINAEVDGVDSNAFWLDRERGIGEYRWEAKDTAVEGRFKYEFKLIRLLDNRSFKLPEEGFYQYLVLEDLEV